MRKITVFLFLLFAATNVFSQKPPLGAARQMILVTTFDWNSVQGKLQRFERLKPKDKWHKVGAEAMIVVGRNGLAWGKGLHSDSIYQPAQQIKREGDGKSPAGVFSLTAAFGTVAVGQTTLVKLPYTPLVESTECVDDVKSGSYNTIVDRRQTGSLDWDSSEKMLAVGEPYALGIFVAHNSNPVRKGMGSCIFLHIWKNSETGTAGCTAMPKENISQIVQWLDPKAAPVLVQLPTEEFKKLRKQWQLPKNN